MSRGIRATVFIIFLILGLSFVSVLGALVYEFRDIKWFDIATIYSQLFLFFPTFGILALCAFYFPACVFLDMYWHHINNGRAGVLLWTAVLAVGALAFAHQLQRGVPAIWQVSPEVLQADTGAPENCFTDNTTSCERLPVLESMSQVRTVSQSWLGLGPFDRDCSWAKREDQKNDNTATDKHITEYLPVPDYFEEKRYCFSTGKLETGQACCVAQDRMRDHMRAMYNPAENRTITGLIHEIVLPFIVFFLLIVFFIGLMLVLRRRSLDQYYSAHLNRLERGVVVGAFAMLFWPLSNHAFLQSSEALFGGEMERSLFVLLTPVFSLLFGAWALMLLFFFLRRYEQDVEMVGKIAGVVVSGIAFLQYEELVGYFEWIAGSGANHVSLGFLGAVLLIAFLQLIIWRRYRKELGE